MPKINNEIKYTSPPPKFKLNLNNYLQSISSVKEDWVVDYVESRMIPNQFWNILFYAPSFKEFTDKICPEHGKILYDEPRLIIPFFDEDKSLLGFQGRAIKENKIRYITIKMSKDNFKIFGMDRIDKSNKINVLEGPLDSLFVKNAVATADSNLRNASKYYPKEDLVLIYDNQYYNSDLQREINGSINEGYDVCLFPKHIHGKDVNEMIQFGVSEEELFKVIQSNTFNGLRAKLEFNLLKG